MAVFLGLCWCSGNRRMNYKREIKWHGHCEKALRWHHFTSYFSTNFKYPPYKHFWFPVLLLPCQSIDWNLSTHKCIAEMVQAPEESCEPVPEIRPSSATGARTEAPQPFPQLHNSTDPVRKAGLLTQHNSQLNGLKNQHSFLLAQAKQNRGASITPL